MTTASPARTVRSRAIPTPTGALTLRTPAKLNLGLRLLGRRDDGYHLLESVFAPIDVCDALEIEVLPGTGQIELEVCASADNALPEPLARVTSGPDNLVFRAAEAFRDAFSIQARIRIRLEKAIPAAAGLGGGSSDAAAILNGLAALAGEDIAEDALPALALGLGADVPFFLEPRPSLVTGIGEVITPLEGLPSCALVVANPGISLDTTEVYRAADALGSALTEPRAGSTMRAFSRLSREYGGSGEPSSRSDSRSGGLDRGVWEDLLVNDLEPAALRLCPPVGRLLAAMRETNPVAASMTGSGATIFGVYESDRAAEEAARELRASVAASGPSGHGKRNGSEEVWIQVSRLNSPD